MASNNAMAAYSLDLRKRIVDAIERGVGTRSEVAKLLARRHFGVRLAQLAEDLVIRRRRGSFATRPGG
jgi:hypothetical protein